MRRERQRQVHANLECVLWTEFMTIESHIEQVTRLIVETFTIINSNDEYNLYSECLIH